MIIRRIALSNFTVYGAEQVFEPAYMSRRTGRSITLVGGLNGRGKTSLLDGVLLALYGSRAPAARNWGRSYSSYLRSLVNENAPAGAESWVELDLETKAETELSSLRIRRSWQRNLRARERLQVWRDGSQDELLTQGWDSYVEEVIPLGLAGLFFFNGETIGDLADSEEPPEEVRAAIRGMLGLDVIDRLILDLGTVIRRNDVRLKRADVQEGLVTLHRKKESLLAQRHRTKQEIAKANTDLERLGEMARRNQEDYLRQGGILSQRHESLQKHQEYLREEAVQAQMDVVNLAAGPLPLLLNSHLLRRIRDRVEQEQESRHARAALPILQQRNRELLAVLCQHTADQQVVARILEECQSQEAELLRLSEGTDLFPISGLGIGQLEELLGGRLEEIKAATAATVELMQQVEARSELLERHSTVVVDQERVLASLREVTRLAQRAAALEQQKMDLQRQVASLEYEIGKVDSSVAEIAEKLVDMEEAGRIIHYAARSRTALEEFRRRVTKSKIERLTRHIAESFALLAHKPELAHEIQMDADSLCLTILDRQGQVIPKTSLSSGEKQMLAVAILWGLAQASRLQLPVVIDTPMGRLDSSHRMSFVTQYLPKASHQVIILSTDTEINGAYLEYLDDYIGQKYLLDYDEVRRETRVREGYFPVSGGQVIV